MQKSNRPFPLTAYFLLVYLFSWLIWIPLLLSHLGVGPFKIPPEVISLVGLLGVLVPATVAIVLSAVLGRGAAVRALLGRLKIWRVGWRWWAAAVIVFPALLLITALVYNLIWGDPPITVIQQISTSLLVINVIALTLATLGEEIGWRGVALPALQKKFSPLISSLILGVLWATWHLPFWLLQDTLMKFGIGYLALDYLFVFPLTMYITWFFNHTRYSLLIPVAFHLSFNLVNVVILQVTSEPIAYAIFIGMCWVVALIILPDLKPKLNQQLE